jgi:hypothetical protein
MGVGVYIATKKKIRGFDPFVNGKAVGRADESELDAVCKAAELQSLWGYVSQNPDDLADFLEGEGLDAEGDGEPEAEEWYEPGEGLAFVRALSGYLKANPNSIKNSTGIVSDLTEYESVFNVLVQKKVKWHFAVDF